MDDSGENDGREIVENKNCKRQNAEVIEILSDDETLELKQKVARRFGPDESTRKNNDDVCQDGTEKQIPTAANNDVTEKFIEPIVPNPNFLIEGAAGQKRRFIIYMAIKEMIPSLFATGLKLIKECCSQDVNESCFQYDGSRHITMFDGYLTNQQARCLSFKNPTFRPIEIGFDGWMPWNAGCYLKVDDESVGKLKHLLGKVDGLPSRGGKRPCNHLSLYRKRDFDAEGIDLDKEFENVRKITHNWGVVVGVSIRLKVIGQPYSECALLAGK